MLSNQAVHVAVFAAATVISSALLADDIRFAYRTDELETSEGRAALIGRMERKARRECRSVSILPPHYESARTACEETMIADLVVRIDDARLRADARARFDRDYALTLSTK
mgnify:CR=1 FL=1